MEEKGRARKRSSILTCPFAHGDCRLAGASCQLPARSPTEHARLSATSGCTSTQLLHHTRQRLQRLQRQFGGDSGAAQFCPIFSPDSLCLCLASSPLNLIQVRVGITACVLLPWLHSQSSDPSPPPQTKKTLAFKLLSRMRKF